MTGFQNRNFVHAPALGFKNETSKEIHEIDGRQIKEEDVQLTWTMVQVCWFYKK